MDIVPINLGMRLTTALAKAALKEGAVLWDEIVYLLPLEPWAGTVHQWADSLPTPPQPVHECLQQRMSAPKRKRARLGEILLALRIDGQPAAWVLPASPWWMARIEGDESRPDPEWLVELGFRQAPGVMTLKAACRELGANYDTARWAAKLRDEAGKWLPPGGLLEAEKRDRHWYVHLDDLRRWLDTRRPGPGGRKGT